MRSLWFILQPTCGQQCQKCRGNYIRPYRVEYLQCPQCHNSQDHCTCYAESEDDDEEEEEDEYDDDDEGDEDDEDDLSKPHRSDLCEMCQKGPYCKYLRSSRYRTNRRKPKC